MIDTHIQGIPCTIEVVHYSAFKGTRESGLPLEPDEPEGFEVLGIYKRGGKGKHMAWLERKMTEEDYERIYEAAFEEMRDMAIDEAEARFENY